MTSTPEQQAADARAAAEQAEAVRRATQEALQRAAAAASALVANARPGGAR